MATTTKSKQAAKKKVANTGPTRAEFDGLANNLDTLAKGVDSLVEMLKKNAEQPAAPAPTPAQVTENKEIAKAAEDKYTVNPEWEDIAREIIGEAVDHTELKYIKGGGLLFTVVLKTEMSNAPIDYLERYKADRRSREVGSEGEAGVKMWCTLIKENLKRPRAYID